MDFTAVKVMTFDCYGTLIDWETGILGAMRPVLNARRISMPDDAILEGYAEFETTAERGPYRSYREVLRDVMGWFAEWRGFSCTEDERNAILASFQHWKPFPDTVESLQRLAKRYKLVILSNIDDDLFALTKPLLEVEFAEIITAQQIGSYKPSHRNFEAAIQRIGLPEANLMHVAQSLFHDIAPAKSLGLQAVWINRRQSEVGGATLHCEVRPDLETPDLKTFADLALAG